MTKILVLNGPNLNLLGLREPALYGTETYAELCAKIEAHANRRGVTVEIAQSNHEGVLVDKIQAAYGDADGIVVIHKQDAAEVLEAAKKKKAGEDRTFELMDSDLETYAKKHEASTEQRADGKGIAFINEVYTKAYEL